MQQTVVFTEGKEPAWDDVAALLAQRNFPVQVRMINGELTFPQEAPPPTWRELRMSTPQGMVTLRREEQGITVVTWGNSDRDLLQASNALAWALAKAGDGQVLTAAGSLSAADFQRAADLPEVLRG
jgi:hypothetical protein